MEIKAVVAETLASQYWCDFHNVCMRQEENEARRLVEHILPHLASDAYLADIEFEKYQGGEIEVILNIYSFCDFPTKRLRSFCKWLSDERLIVSFSWFAYMTSSEDDPQDDDDEEQ